MSKRLIRRVVVPTDLDQSRLVAAITDLRHRCSLNGLDWASAYDQSYDLWVSKLALPMAVELERRLKVKTDGKA